jgi:hypothetical protein
MNEYDRNNLEFLLSLKTDADWRDWFECTDTEDHTYAMELIKTAQSELVVRTMELHEENLETEDFSQAQQFLNRFRLNT